LNAALNDEIDEADFIIDQRFGFSVPTHCAGVPSSILQPRETWDDKKKFDNVANLLSKMFIENFDKYTDKCNEDVIAAAPIVLN
jgi:phosphoenolpyruvate carboxykinase (ATP)